MLPGIVDLVGVVAGEGGRVMGQADPHTAPIGEEAGGPVGRRPRSVSRAAALGTSASARRHASVGGSIHTSPVRWRSSMSPGRVHSHATASRSSWTGSWRAGAAATKKRVS